MMTAARPPRPQTPYYGRVSAGPPRPDPRQGVLAHPPDRGGGRAVDGLVVVGAPAGARSVRRAHAVRVPRLSPLLFSPHVQDLAAVSIPPGVFGADLGAEGRALVGGT